MRPHAGGKVNEKFAAIDNLYAADSAPLMGKALFYPATSALLYIFIYPLLGTLAIWVYRSYQVWASNVVKKVEKSRILSPEDAAELTRRLERERRTWEKQSAAQDSELKELRRALEQAEEEARRQNSAEIRPIKSEQDASDTPAHLMEPPSTAEEEVPSPNAVNEEESEGSVLATNTTATTEGFRPLESKLLVKFSESGATRSTKELASLLGANYTVVEAALQKLKQLGLLKVSVDQVRGNRWSLSSEGKNVVLQLLPRGR